MALISQGQPIPPQALAETSPQATISYWYGHDGMSLVDRWASYSAIYQSQPVLSGIVDKIAALTARLSLKVQDTTNPDAIGLDRDSDYARLLQDPCPYMNAFAFWTWWVTTEEIYGEVYGYKMRNAAGQVIGVCPMHPTRTWVERDSTGREKFTFTLGVANVGLLECYREDVILSRRYNPDTPMRGLSRLHSLTRTIQNEDAIRTSMSSTWQRGMQPIIALKMEGKMSDTNMAKFRAKLEERHSGPSKAGGILLLPAGVDAVPLQIDPKNMQLIESLKLTREEVCIRIDFPPPAAHILDHATFANITEQMRSMYRDSMAPRLEAIEAVLDWDLRTEFYKDPVRRAKFDLDEVLRGDFEVRVEAATKMVLNGIATPAEARVMFGLPRLDDPAADVLYANQAMQPLGTPVAGANVGGNPPPAPVPPPPPVKAVAVRLDDQRSISGRIGRKVSKDSDRDTRMAVYRDEILKVITDVVQDQKSTVLGMVSSKALRFDVGPFDSLMAKSLEAAIGSVALASGRSVDSKYALSEDLGISDAAYDAAHGLNAATMTAVNAALGDGADADAIEKVFDVRLALLALAAGTIATRWMGEAELDSATRFKRATTKTWHTGANPRPAHAKMNGETVRIDSRFSNGQRHPGDGSEADQVAGCNCSLSFGAN